MQAIYDDNREATVVTITFTTVITEEVRIANASTVTAEDYARGIFEAYIEVINEYANTDILSSKATAALSKKQLQEIL